MSSDGELGDPPLPLRMGRCLHRPPSPGGAGTWVAEWVLKPNCSLKPSQLLAFYLSLCGLSLGIAAFFWLRGATMVLPFAVLELLLVGVALLVYARHASDFERVTWEPGRWVVERRVGSRSHRDEFQTDWVQIDLPPSGRSLVALAARGRQVQVGRHVRPELRRQLAEEFRAALRWGTRQGGTARGGSAC